MCSLGRLTLTSGLAAEIVSLFTVHFRFCTWTCHLVGKPHGFRLNSRFTQGPRSVGSLWYWLLAKMNDWLGGAGPGIACHSPLCIQINNIPKSRKINGRQKVENSSYFRKIVYTVIGEKVINKWILLYARIQFKEVCAKVFYCLENAFQQQKGYIGIKCGLRFLSSTVQWVPTHILWYT